MLKRGLLGVLIFAVSVVGLTMGATLPLVSLRLHDAGASSLVIGIVSAMPAAGMILAAALTHLACRRFSGRTLYLGCFVLCALSAGSVDWLQASVVPLAVARLCMGLGMGLIVILGESWVNQLCNPATRGQTVAFYAACFTGCQLGGPALVSMLGTHSTLTIAIIGIANLLTLVLVWYQLPEALGLDSEEDARSFSLLGFIRVAPALCIAVLFFSFFDTVVLSLFPVYATNYGYAVGVAALMASVILGGDMLFQVPLGWLSDRMDRRTLHLACGLLTLAISLALPWLITNPGLLWPALILLGAAAGSIYTLALILIGEDFRGADLVTANASIGMLWGIGSLSGPLLSGAMMESDPQGLPLALCLTASAFVVAALKALRVSRRVLS